MFDVCAKGFRIRETNFAEIQLLVKNYGEWLAKQHEEMFYAHVKSLTTVRAVIGSKGSIVAVALLAWEMARQGIAEAIVRNVDVSVPAYETDLLLCFLPLQDSEYTYGFCVTKNADWFFAWLDQPSVEDFSYWEAEGENHGLPADVWQFRKELWQKLLPAAEDDLTTCSFRINPTSPDSPLTDDFKARLVRQYGGDVIHEITPGCTCPLCEYYRQLDRLGKQPVKAQPDDSSRKKTIRFRLDVDAVKAVLMRGGAFTVDDLRNNVSSGSVSVEAIDVAIKELSSARMIEMIGSSPAGLAIWQKVR